MQAAVCGAQLCKHSNRIIHVDFPPRVTKRAARFVPDRPVFAVGVAALQPQWLIPPLSRRNGQDNGFLLRLCRSLCFSLSQVEVLLDINVIALGVLDSGVEDRDSQSLSATDVSEQVAEL